MKNRAYISHFDDHQSALKEIQGRNSLRELLAERFQLNDYITFRKNTSLVILDLISVLMTDGDYDLVYTNLEHPCIIDFIERIVPEERRRFINVYPQLLTGDLAEIEHKILSDNDRASVFFISHVIWNCGIVMDVEKISSRIKARNTSHVVIVDGAQAVGNLEHLFLDDFQSTEIDIYVGCTHKWVGTKTLLGFASFRKDWIMSSDQLRQSIFLRDIFSQFAGTPKGFEFSWPMSTYDLFLLKRILLQLEHVDSADGSESLIFKELPSGLKMIPGMKSLSSKFLAFLGSKTEVRKAISQFNLSEMCLVDDPYLPEGQVWLRVEKASSLRK